MKSQVTNWEKIFVKQVTHNKGQYPEYTKNSQNWMRK